MKLVQKKATKQPVRDPYQVYSQLKREWENQNPDATPEQYQKAMTEIAERLGV